MVAIDAAETRDVSGLNAMLSQIEGMRLQVLQDHMDYGLGAEYDRLIDLYADMTHRLTNAVYLIETRSSDQEYAFDPQYVFDTQILGILNQSSVRYTGDQYAIVAFFAGASIGIGGASIWRNLRPATNTGRIGDRAAERVTWVDENTGVVGRARNYDDSAMGARSNVDTQRRQAPALTRTLEDGSTATVRFDGVDGDVLVDRKISVVTTTKAKDQAARQSAALAENGLTGRWEVPTQAQANRANRVFEELGIENITVRVVPE